MAIANLERSLRTAVAAVAVLTAGAPTMAKLVAPGLTPIRGWTSWDLTGVKGHPQYGPDFLTADAVLAQSAALAQSPLGAAGYDHVNIDSFWSMNPTQVVDEFGRWAVNRTRFPEGLASVSAKIHARGQKLGLYINPGVAVAAVKQRRPIQGTNCTADEIAVTPWQAGNRFWDCYKIDWSHRCAMPYVQSFANLLVDEYEIDFLKIDAVSPGSPAQPDWNSTLYNTYTDVAKWSAALEATGRPVWIAISWKIDPSAGWEFRSVANSWRTSMDICCYCNTLTEWAAVERVFDQVKPWVSCQRPRI